MWQQISNNKKNTFFLIFGMLLVLILLGAVIGTAVFAHLEIDFQQKELLLFFIFCGSIISVIIWLVQLIAALSAGKKTVLSLGGACKLPQGTHLVLENVVEEMTIAAGLAKKPEIYVIDSSMPNAFATGLNPQNSAIAVTTGLLTQLNRDELQGVVAHEIAHIYNRDTMYMIFAAVMITSITIVADLGVRLFFNTGYTGASSSRRSSGGNSGGSINILVLLCIIFMILAPVFAQILYFLVSQKREYLADACSAQFTRYPQGLASALQKISSFSSSNQVNVDKIISPMYIVNPKSADKLNLQKEKNSSMFNNIWSTHPPTSKRIEVLLKMTGADFKAYNNAFMKVAGNRKPVLDKNDLSGVKKIDIVIKDNIANHLPASSLVQTDASTKTALKSRKSEVNDNLIDRKRNAEDILWKANNYIFKECQCGTKMKFPHEYYGQTIFCPHCGNAVLVSENQK